MKSEYTYDYIHDTDVFVYQKRNMFRINTDTANLASFMKVKEKERVLDIGTNNGALLAVAAKFQPSLLFGIEIQKEAADLARYNMDQLDIKNATIICGDVRELKMPKVDVVVCNPPYFKVEEDSNTNISYAMATARHEIFLSLDDLAKKASEALNEKGRLYMVHRANRISEILLSLKAQRLEARMIQFVYDKAKDCAISVLIEAVKDGKANCHVLAPRYIDR